NVFQIIDELTIEAYLHADSTAQYIFFGKVVPLDSLITPLDEELSPVIVDGEGNIFPLQPTGEDGRYENSVLTLQSESTYQLEVEYNGKMVTASTYIPEAPARGELSVYEIQRTQINDFEDIFNQEQGDPVEVRWEAAPDTYYFVSVKNIELDPNPINTLFEEEDIGIVREGFTTEPFIGDRYAITPFDITHFGTHEVTIYRVNPEYVLLYEDPSNGAAGLNEIRTNVENGFGIFTGINSTTLYLEVEQL
ncbi:MAG: DUF4249 family protein, partial [Bacteroidota bacterium]